MLTAFLVIFFSAALAVCTALKPVFLNRAIDAIPGEGAFSYFLIYVICIVGILVFELMRQLLTGRYQAAQVSLLKRRLIRRFLKMPARQFQSEDGQTYITILNQEIEMLVENFYVQRLEFAYSVLVLVFCTAALVYIHWLLAILILVGTVLPIIVSSLQGKRLRRRTNLYTESLERLNVMIGNLIQGYPTLKTNRAEKSFGKTMEEHVRDTEKAGFAKSGTRSCVNLLIGTLAYAGEIVLVGASILLIARGYLTVGALVGALQISEMLAIPTNSIAYQLGDMNSVRGIREKIESMLSQPEEEESQANSCPEIRSIEFCDVSFRYGDRYVLKNLNYRFEAGKKYLIVGENGSGKSTLFKLLSKFEEDYEGKILINGIDLRAIDGSFFDRVGIVLQSTFMMNDTLFHNLTLYQGGSHEAAEQALNSLGMEAFLKDHPLDEPYQDTKGNLSGGEKQRIALARILMQDKRTILLDEATSAIDPESSYQIEERLLRSEEILLINIEHKIIPELVPLYDAVLELKDAVLQNQNSR